MSDIITFYHNPMSRGRIAHWMLEEAGAEYEVKVLRFDQGEHKKADYLAINPMGKIPAIVHRGTVVTECAAICAYLGDAFPTAKLAPALDDPRRGTYLRWLFFAAGCVESAVLDHATPRTPSPPRSALGYGSYEDTLGALEKAIAPGPFILGDWFTAADVYIASQLGWGLMMKSIDPRPSFQAYVARCAERPAFKRFVEKSDRLAQDLQKSA